MSNSHENIRYKSITPILRIFDIDKAKQFYLDFLEFSLDGEHRFEEGLPLYLFLSMGDCRLHLSEHHGDGTPGTAIRIEVSGIETLHAKLLAKVYPYARPGLKTTPWNTTECQVIDPFGNRLTFYESRSPLSPSFSKT